MRWMETSELRRDRQVLLNRAMDLMDEIQYALNRLGELR
jgi:hypothetical protein